MRSSKMSFTETLELLNEAVEGHLVDTSADVLIEGTYYPGCPATHWDPPEGPEFSFSCASFNELLVACSETSTELPELAQAAALRLREYLESESFIRTAEELAFDVVEREDRDDS